MAMSEYMRRIREKIGHDHLLIPAAGALVRDGGGGVLLVRHFEGHRQLPGGATDPAERPEDAARRECREESSIEIRLVRFAGVFRGEDYRVTYANGDEIGVVAIAFHAEIVGGSPQPGDDETQDVRWFSPAELRGLDLRQSTRATLRSLLPAT